MHVAEPSRAERGTPTNLARTTRLLLLALLMPVVVGLAACGSSSSDSGSSSNSAGASNKPIVIGAAIGQSGVLSPYDLPPLGAVRLAIEDINKKGGVLGRQLKLVVSDMQSVPSNGPRAALSVLGSGAKLVIVSCDYDIGSPAAVTAQSKNVIAFSTCAAAPQFGPKGIGPLAYTMASAAQSEGVIVSDFAFKHDCKNAYLMVNTDLEYFKSVGEGLKQGMAKAGGTIVGTSTFTQAQLNARAVVAKFLAASPKPQCALLAFNSFSGGAVLRQLRASGYDGPIYGANSWDGDYWKKLSPNLSNFYFAAYASMYGDDPNPDVNEIVKRWRDANGGKMPDNANLVTGYSVIEAWAKAANAAKSLEGTEVAAQLSKFKDVKLLVGPTTYTPQVHISLDRPMAMMKIENGKSSYDSTLAPSFEPKIVY